MWKACSRCGKIHSDKYQCCAIKRKYGSTEERALRNRYAWARKSREIRDRANYLCEVCKAKGIYQYNSLEVHHIIPLREDDTRLLDNTNLICLCVECHKKSEKGEISKEYLEALARAREYGDTPPPFPGE